MLAITPAPKRHNLMATTASEPSHDEGPVDPQKQLQDVYNFEQALHQILNNEPNICGTKQQRCNIYFIFLLAWNGVSLCYLVWRWSYINSLTSLILTVLPLIAGTLAFGMLSCRSPPFTLTLPLHADPVTRCNRVLKHFNVIYHQPTGKLLYYPPAGRARRRKPAVRFGETSALFEADGSTQPFSTLVAQQTMEVQAVKENSCDEAEDIRRITRVDVRRTATAMVAPAAAALITSARKCSRAPLRNSGSSMAEKNALYATRLQYSSRWR